MRPQRLGLALAVTTALVLPAGVARADDRTQYAQSPLLDPLGPAAAPDGSVWFAENGASRLGRVAPDATVTEFAVPVARRRAEYDALRVEAVGPDGRVWFVRESEPRVGALDPVSGAVRFLDVGLQVGAAAVTPDGAVWLAGDNGELLDQATLVRIAPDGTRSMTAIGRKRARYGIAAAATPGAVVVLLIAGEYEEGDALTAVHVDAGAVAAPIALPKASNLGESSIASGPAGTFISAAGSLLKVDGDRVARRVPGVRTARDDLRRAVGLGLDGSIWLTGGIITRLMPGSALARFPIEDLEDGVFEGDEGITVATSNDAWVAKSGIPLLAGPAKRERLLRYSPSGQVSELVLGMPPRASATVLSGVDAGFEADKLARGVRRTLRVRVRCSAACAVRVAVVDEPAKPGTFYARRTVRLGSAGARIVTLRSARRSPIEDIGLAYALSVRLEDRSGYLRRSPAQRGAGRLIPVPSATSGAVR